MVIPNFSHVVGVYRSRDGVAEDNTLMWSLAEYMILGKLLELHYKCINSERFTPLQGLSQRHLMNYET